MASMQSLIGQTLGQYKVTEQVGEGGMALVFRAHQPGLNRDVALKILPPYIAEKKGFTERFSREAQAIGNLHHPNILPVYDSGQDKGYGYIAMRYVPNARTLTDLMKAPLPTEQIIRLVTQIAGALDHAHQAGIVHRDIKPSNILMDNDWVLLSDFGLAKMVETPSELTGSGVGIGTPAYMSPEQAKGQKIDNRTDIYSLGIILFEMLTGHVPHKAETPLATVVKRINEPLPMPRSLNPDMPKAAEQVLLKALASNPNDRFEKAGALATALQAAYDEQPLPDSVDSSNDTGLSVPVPSDAARSRLAAPIQKAAPAFVPSQSSGRTGVVPLEVVAMTLLGVISLCGLGGALISFGTNSNTGESNIALLPACSGMMFAGLTSILMIWIRDRSKAASAWLALGIVSWFIGINILGWGGFAALSPGDSKTFVENLGFSLVLCFTPGALFSLVGLGFYGYDFRKNRRAGPTVSYQANASSEASRERAARLKRAREYRTHIVALIKQKKGSNLGQQLTPMLTKLNQWEAHLQQLVTRLDDFETDRIIQQDIREVPAAISRLQTQMGTETNPYIQKEMAETLTKQQIQRQQLDALVTLMRRTELDIDETLADIGAIYSQLQMLGAKDIDGSRAKRMSEDINEQANHLGDLLEAMDDVYESS